MGGGLPRLSTGSVFIVASSCVALAQISMRSRSCAARSFTRRLEM